MRRPPRSAQLDCKNEHEYRCLGAQRNRKSSFGDKGEIARAQKRDAGREQTSLRRSTDPVVLPISGFGMILTVRWLQRRAARHTRQYECLGQRGVSRAGYMFASFSRSHIISLWIGQAPGQGTEEPHIDHPLETTFTNTCV